MVASGILWSADFEVPVGGALTLPAGLTNTRASTATVQTGLSTLETVGVDVARAGRINDTDAFGFVVEESRTNVMTSARGPLTTGWTAGQATTTALPNATPAPDGSTVTVTRITSAKNLYGTYYTRAVADGTVQISAWSRATSAPFLSTSQFGGVVQFSLTLAWQRFTASHPAVGTYFITPQNASLDPLAPAQDGLWDLLMIEIAAFVGEWHPAGATRAADQPVITTSLIDNGRVTFELLMVAKGGRAAYAADPVILYGSADDHIEIDRTNGKVKVTCAGATHTTVLAGAFSSRDTLRWYIEVGNGAPLVILTVNADEPLLLSIDDPAAQGAWTATAPGFLGNAGSGVFSCWARKAWAYTSEGDWV